MSDASAKPWQRPLAPPSSSHGGGLVHALTGNGHSSRLGETAAADRAVPVLIVEAKLHFASGANGGTKSRAPNLV